MTKKTITLDILTLDDATQKKIMQQYEDIRQSGLTNMFNFTNVRHIAGKTGKHELYAFISGDDGQKRYMSVLKNFGKLMKKFDIKQN